MDGDRIRPHFNAGLLAIRPEFGLLLAWREVFARQCRRAAFEPFHQRDFRYRLFVHQAILTGTLLARLARDAIELLPVSYNYPLHLHAHFPPDRAASRLNDLITCRYDSWSFFQQPGWQDTLPIDEPLRSWLLEQVGSSP